MKKDDFLKPAGFLFIITVIVAIINFAYNIAMGRMLSVSDFGDLRALFSILMILAIPTSAIQTMIAKFTVEYYKTNLGKLKSLSLDTLTFLLILGSVFIVIFAGFRHVISSYLRISSPNLIVLLGPVVLLSLIGPLIWGIYQGLQRFVLLGTNILLGTILKLVFGIFFVYLGYATLGVLCGLIIAGILLLLLFGSIAIYLLNRDVVQKEVYSKGNIYSYSGYALGVLVCFSIISQIDILIVKHKFMPQDAGLYAIAAVIGKAFLFLPVPVVTVLFPKVVDNNKKGKNSLPILMQSLLITCSLCIVGIGVCWFFPQHLIGIFGQKYMPAISLFRIFGLAMTPVALFYVIMNYFLSAYRLKFFYYCLLMCILGITILAYLPQSLRQFLLVLGCYGLIMFILPLVYILSEAQTYGAPACRQAGSEHKSAAELTQH